MNTSPCPATRNTRGDSIFARPLAFRRMQTFRAVPERGHNLEAAPMTGHVAAVSKMSVTKFIVNSIHKVVFR
jgi:hypothetical protein